MDQAYRFLTPVSLRWGDQDAMGHVNNARFLTYFEEARICFFESLGASIAGGSLTGQAPILAKIDCTFAQQLTWPGTIEVGIRVARIGTKSFTLAHAISQEDRAGLIAHGEAVIVWFDYDAQATIPIPDVLRAALERWA